MTNAQLAHELAQSELSGDEERVALAMNEIASRLEIGLEHTEQGIDAYASEMIEAFMGKWCGA